MLWVKESIDDKIIIVAEILTYVYTCIYAAYAAYSDMIIHTGGAISMGHEVFQKNVSVKRLNTNLSTEEELVGVSEYLP